MADVPNRKSTVTSVRKKYGETLTKDQCVELCNEVAWIHRLEADGGKFGIAEKKSGTRGKRRDGQEASIDGLVYRHPDGKEQFVDILGNADGTDPPAAVPRWDVADTSNRKWVAPIVPIGGPVPTPDPDPPPTPDPTPEPEYATKAELVALGKRLDDQITALRVEMLAHVKGLQEQIAVLDKRQYVVRGRTGQEAWHSHPVNLDVGVKE